MKALVTQVKEYMQSITAFNRYLMSVTALVSVVILGCTPPKNGDATFSLKVIHTNDHHSHLDGSSYDLSFDGVRTRLTLGGFSRLVSVIERERDTHSIVLNSGELNGTLYFSLFKGEPDVKVFNAVGLDAYALGNHEFDEGDGRLAELIDLASFPVIASNMQPTDASPLYAVRDKIEPYTVKEIQGQKIGIIGILKVEKTKNSSMVSDDVTFTEEIATAGQYVAELEAMGVNKIILVSHVGYFNDILIAKNVPGIDVIVGGDTHSLLDSTGRLEEIGLAPKYGNQTGAFAGYDHLGFDDEPLGSYPTMVTGPNGDPVAIVQAWEYAYGLGVLHVDFRADGTVDGAEGNIILPVDGPFFQKNDAGKFVEVTAEVGREILAAIQASPILTQAEVSDTIEEILQPYRDEIEVTKNLPIGTIAATMDVSRIPTPFNPGEHPSGSHAAFVVAQAFRTTNPRIDVAIQNAGGVRTELLEGPFTVGDAIKTLPFSNTVVTLDMTGEEIVRVLNQAAFYALNSGSTGAFPYAAGLRYDVTLGADEGEVITDVEVQVSDERGWIPITPHFVYTVATNSFTALGKDNYLEFAAVRDADPAAFENTHINYYVPLKEYLEELPNKRLEPIAYWDYCLKSVRE